MPGWRRPCLLLSLVISSLGLRPPAKWNWWLRWKRIRKFRGSGTCQEPPAPHFTIDFQSGALSSYSSSFHQLNSIFNLGKCEEGKDMSDRGGGRSGFQEEIKVCLFLRPTPTISSSSSSLSCRNKMKRLVRFYPASLFVGKDTRSYGLAGWRSPSLEGRRWLRSYGKDSRP